MRANRGVKVELLLFVFFTEFRVFVIESIDEEFSLSVKMWTPSVLTNFISSASRNVSESGNSSAAESFKYAAIAGDLKGGFYLPLDIDDTVTCFCR